MVQCRICKGDHWTTKCPYKDTLGTLKDSMQDPTGTPPNEAADAGAARAGSGTGKYIPPSQRGGAGARAKEGESMNGRGARGMYRCRLAILGRLCVYIDC